MRGAVYNLAFRAGPGKPRYMSRIISFLTAFCVGGVLLGALYILAPEGAFKKPLKYLFGVCFVCCIVSFFPVFSNMDITADLSSFTLESAPDANLYAARLTVVTALEKAGITCKSIDITPAYDAAGNITELSVTVVSNEDPQKIKNAIESENIKVSVINE